MDTTYFTNRKFKKMSVNILSIFVILAIAFPVASSVHAQESILAPALADANLLVNTVEDELNEDGDCSLREAIQAANTNTTVDACPAGGDSDVINFSDNYTITLGDQLPVITTSISIIGNGVGDTIIQANTNSEVATYRVFFITSTGDLTLSDLTVRHGNCSVLCSPEATNGGGVYNDGGTLTISNSTFANNNASQGAAIFNHGMSTITNSTFVSNSASYAGAIANDATMTIFKSTFSNNSAWTTGGGISNWTGTLAVSDSTFVANSQLGIYNYMGTATISGSTFSNNSSNSYGGAIYNNAGTMSVTNSTFSGNTSSSYGGGIDNDGTLVVSNSTFSGNGAYSGGGISNLGILHLKNSILADSTSGGDCLNYYGTFATNINNLIEDNTCDPAISGEANLGPLDDNGGPTQTYSLLSGSPAIDAGNPDGCTDQDGNLLSVDQRGEPRPVDGNGDGSAVCDIGAFEAGETAPPPNPFIAVSITINWISLTSFLPDTPVTLSIYEFQGASTPVVELSRTTDPSGNVFIQPWEYNWDVEPGNYVVATDGVNIKDLILEYLTLDVFDPDHDLISGKALPGRKVDVGVGNADGEQWLTVFADETTGIWTADFTTVGFDITADMWAGGHVNDEDGDVTAAHNSGPPSPHFTVFPEWEWFDGLDWTDGSSVTITVAGKPECETVKESWGAFFNGSFGAGCDLVIGDTVTFTDGVTTRTHTVQNLGIKSINAKNDTIKGNADPGAEVYVWPHATGQQQLAITDADGIWKVSFAGIFDLVPGESGRSEIRDEFGNATAVDWHVSNPYFTVFPEWEWFDGMDWADGSKVTISVAGKPECKVKKTSWGGFFNGSFGEGCDVMPGDTVTFKDGMTTRNHVVQNLAVTAVDAEADTIAGTADPGAVVNVWPHATGQQLQATADSTGNWQVDFTEVFDLVPGECGRSQINDALGNATAVDWCVPSPPRIVIQITDDWFRAENFAPNTPLNFWIYSAQDGDLLLNSTTEPTDDGGTVTHWVGDKLDLLPGNYVVVSDGSATKNLVVEGFTFDVLDLTNGILQGTAPEPFGRAVWVGIGWQDQTEWTADVTTDETGTWLAQFEAPVPNNYWWVAAQIFDADGDASEVRPSPRMLTTGNFYIAWSQNNPEEVLYLSWKGSGNLTNPWEHPNCQGDLEFFGNSWVTETDIFWASLAGWGTTGDWSQTDSTINIQSTSSGCPGSAGFPINTQYRFFEAQPDLIMIQRTFEFGDTSYAHDVRPFIPRLYPSDGFTQVLHPNASGDELVVEGTCDFGCIAESWDGSWFAIHNPATGLGMIVQRVSSSYTSALWLDDDDGSFTNATSFLLLQPDGGFTGTVMETEYLCFYDSATWTPSLTLPDGCQP